MDVEKMVTAVRVRDAITHRLTLAEEDLILLQSWVPPTKRSCPPDELAQFVINDQLPPVSHWPGKAYYGVFKRTA